MLNEICQRQALYDVTYTWNLKKYNKLGGSDSKESACNAEDLGSISGSGEDPLEEGHGNPLQYSCLENPMDRGAWRATVHGVAKSRTQLKRLSMHAVNKTKRS